MTTDTAARIAADYVDRLIRSAKAVGLPESRRHELVEQIGDHLDEAAAHATGDSAVAVLDAVDRLGDPEAIVAEAVDTGLGTGEDQARAITAGAGLRPGERYVGAAEAVALVGLPFGWLVFGFGGLIGIVALVMSTRWTTREKLVAAPTAFGPLMALYTGLVLAVQTTSTSSSGRVMASPVDGSGASAPMRDVVVQTSGGVGGGIGQVLVVIAVVALFLSPCLASGFLWWRLRARDPRRTARVLTHA